MVVNLWFAVGFQRCQLKFWDINISGFVGYFRLSVINEMTLLGRLYIIDLVVVENLRLEFRRFWDISTSGLGGHTAISGCWTLSSKSLPLKQLAIFDSPRFALEKIIFVDFYRFLARDSIKRAIMLSPVRLSVYPSVTRVDQSKAVEVRIMQFSPYSSSIPLLTDFPERGRQTRVAWRKQAIFSVYASISRRSRKRYEIRPKLP